MSNELELKLELDLEALGTLRDEMARMGASGMKQSQLSVYFDTKDGRVREAGYSLRVRRAKGGFVQTVKPVATAAGLFDREEWDAPVATLRPERDALAQSPLSAVLTAHAMEELMPVVRTEVERTIWLIDYRDSQLEVSLDEGSIRSGQSEQRLLELEVELKEGDAASVIAFVRAIARHVPLRLGVLSKAERGFALAEGKLSRPFRAGPVRLDTDAPVADALAAVVHGSLKHFRLNEPLLLADGNPVALQEAGRAIRTLRSTLSTLAPLISDSHLHSLLDELQWAAERLDAAARARPVQESLGKGPPSAPQSAAADAASDEGLAQALRSQRFRDLLLDLLAWLEIGEWRQGAAASARLPEEIRQKIEGVQPASE